MHTARWEALQNGKIDCAPQPAPWNFLAKDAGYNLLGEVNSAIPEIVFAALVGKRSWLQQNQDTVQRLLKALIKAHGMTNDPRGEDIALRVFRRITTPESESLARRGLAYMRDMGMWPDGLAIPPKALETTIDLMIRANLLDASKREAARGVFDPRYLDQARAG